MTALVILDDLNWVWPLKVFMIGEMEYKLTHIRMKMEIGWIGNKIAVFRNIEIGCCQMYFFPSKIV